MLAVAVEGEGEVEAVLAGVGEAGVEGHALALVADVLEDGGTGGAGAVGGGVGGAVVDDDDVGAELAGFGDDGRDGGFLAVGGDEDTGPRRRGSGIDGGEGHGL